MFDGNQQWVRSQCKQSTGLTKHGFSILIHVEDRIHRKPSDADDPHPAGLQVNKHGGVGQASPGEDVQVEIQERIRR